MTKTSNNFKGFSKEYKEPTNTKNEEIKVPFNNYTLKDWIKDSDIDGRKILFQFTDSDIPILHDCINQLIIEERKETIEDVEKMIDEIITKKKIGLMNDGLIINEWWSSEIFSGLDIDIIKQQLKELKEKK